MGSIVYIYNSQISVYRPDILTHSQIVNDLGLQFVQPQKNQQESWLTLSIEMIPQYDADYLFVVANDESLPLLNHPI